MAPLSAELHVLMRGHEDSDAEERAELAAQLASELHALGAVRHPPAPDPPGGAKGTALEWASLVVTLAGALPALVGAIQSWLDRRGRRTSVTLRLGDDESPSTPRPTPSSASCCAPSSLAMTPGERPPAKRRALLVASGTYADSRLRRLRAPTGDVEALESVLSDPDIGGFDVDCIVDQGTPDVKHAIEEFFAAGGLNDLLLLYISGHGVMSEDGRLYFASSSMQLDFLDATAIDDSLARQMRRPRTRTRSIVLILDCCHSGAFERGHTRKGSLSVGIGQRFIADEPPDEPRPLIDGRGHVVLTASSELEYAFEDMSLDEFHPSQPGSHFTRFLVEGLRTGDADLDEDGLVAVHEVYDYVFGRTREHSRHQTPGMMSTTRDGKLVASAGDDRSARVWSLSERRELDRRGPDSFEDGMLRTVTYRKRYWGVPKQRDGGVIFYRPGTDGAPATWRQVLDRAVPGPGHRLPGLRLRLDGYEGLTVVFLELAYAAGADDIVSQDGRKAKLYQPGTLAALDFMREALERRAVPESVTSQDDKGSFYAFSAGRARFLAQLAVHRVALPARGAARPGS